MIHRLETKTFIPSDIDNVWSFFSSPLNLSKITPEWLGLKIKDKELVPKSMYAGMIICYDVNLFLGLKTEWVTEITHVKDKAFFVDEQRFGPYSFWHHQHHFKEVEGGVENTDIVHYKLPGGPDGSLLGASYVKNRLDQIFSYREERIKELFP